MAEKSEVYKGVVKHKGFWNYSEIYKFAYAWLKDEGYNISEDNYTEKVTSFGKEIAIKWTSKKKVSDYFRNIITVSWHILGMTDSEIERAGKKEKTNKGEIKLTFTATLERDYEKRWEDKPFWKMMRGVYDKYVIRTTMDEYEDRLQSKVLKFIEETKSFLQLEGKH
jgi:hypothetical protein